MSATKKFSKKIDKILDKILNWLRFYPLKILLVLLPLIIAYFCYKIFIMVALILNYRVRIDAFNLFLFLKFYEVSGFPVDNVGVGDWGYYCQNFRSYDHYYSFLLLHKDSFIGHFLVVILLLALIVPAFSVLWVRILRAFLNPMGAILGLNLKECDDKEVDGLVSEVCRDFDIEKPDIALTDEPIGNVVSAHLFRRTLIVIPKIVLQNLTRKELKAILAHEAWHIKRDLETATRFVAISNFPSKFFKGAVFAWIIATFVSYFLMGIPIVALYIETIALAVIPLLLIVVEGLLDVSRMANPKFREYEADFMASLHIRNHLGYVFYGSYP